MYFLEKESAGQNGGTEGENIQYFTVGVVGWVEGCAPAPLLLKNR